MYIPARLIRRKRLDNRVQDVASWAQGRGLPFGKERDFGMKQRTWLWVAVGILSAAILAMGILIAARLTARADRAESAAETAPPTTAAAAEMAEGRTPEPEPTPTPADEDLVVVRDCIPSLYVELRYATTNNFTGQRIYDFRDARLRYGTVKKLMRVQAALLEQGYSLKIWDAFRPVSAQFRLWEVCPNGAYVANPNTGYSSHSRGNTVDLTMVKADGTEIPMPSGFDEFSALADRNYGDVSAEARQNVTILETAMQAEGFVGYSAEWWHYSDSTAYAVVTDS